MEGQRTNDWEQNKHATDLRERRPRRLLAHALYAAAADRAGRAAVRDGALRERDNEGEDHKERLGFATQARGGRTRAARRVSEEKEKCARRGSAIGWIRRNVARRAHARTRSASRREGGAAGAQARRTHLHDDRYGAAAEAVVLRPAALAPGAPAAARGAHDAAEKRAPAILKVLPDERRRRWGDRDARPERRAGEEARWLLAARAFDAPFDAVARAFPKGAHGVIPLALQLEGAECDEGGLAGVF